MPPTYRKGVLNPNTPLTTNQKRFVEAYNGKLSETARKCGFSHAYSCQLIRNPKIIAAIQKRQKNGTSFRSQLIATRDERQQFWSRVMCDDSQPMLYRLKASELLGKSQADFTEKLIVDDIRSELKNLSEADLIERLRVLHERFQNLIDNKSTTNIDTDTDLTIDVVDDNAKNNELNQDVKQLSIIGSINTDNTDTDNTDNTDTDNIDNTDTDNIDIPESGQSGQSGVTQEDLQSIDREWAHLIRDKTRRRVDIDSPLEAPIIS